LQLLIAQKCQFSYFANNLYPKTEIIDLFRASLAKRPVYLTTKLV